MKTSSIHFYILTLVFLSFLIINAFSQNVEGEMIPKNQAMKTKKSNIIYIDLNISQPNLEKCLTTSDLLELTEDEKFKIYPNPNTGLFTLELNIQKTGKFVNILIYDQNGKRVYQSIEIFEGDHFMKELNLSFLSKGIYFIRVEDSNFTIAKQLIIN